MTDSMKKGFFAGIDLGGTKILTVVTDSEKRVLAKTKIPTEAALGVDTVLGNIFKSLDISCKECGISAQNHDKRQGILLDPLRFPDIIDAHFRSIQVR